MLTGTLTLNPATLPEPADAVYLLVDAELGPDATAVYEATLDGGVTWVPVTPSEITALGHSGTTMQLRVTLSLPEGSEDTGHVYWLIAYATTAA